MAHIVEKSLFALPKVQQQQFVGEVGTFMFFWCQVSSGWCTPIFLNWWIFHRVIKKRTFLRHSIQLIQLQQQQLL